MNCDLCNEHILATTQIAWQGKSYHPSCIGQAVAEQRAESKEDREIKEALNDFDDDFENFDDPEDFDDLEPEEELDSNVIVPEVVSGNGVSHVQIPQGGVLVAPRAIIHPPQNGNSTLMAHCGSNRMTRGELLGLPMPEETDTFKPISHYFLVQAIEEALSFRHISITKEEYAVTPDGMKFFAVLQVNAQYEGVNFAIGLRNANDKSMRLGIVAGYKVFVCDNLSFAGEYKPMLAKHSKNLDLIESVSTAVDRLQRGWKPIREMIDFKRQHQLSDGKARDMLYQLFTDAKLPISLFRSTHKEFFINPSYDEFRPKTLWSLENAVTTAFKRLNPISQYENTAKLGKFINDYTTSI
jgi:hypothetical protein